MQKSPEYHTGDFSASWNTVLLMFPKKRRDNHLQKRNGGSMKKRKLQNLGMLLIIALIILGGIFATGYIKGWFHKNESFVVSQKTGIVTVERKGLAYQIKQDNAIQKQDILSTNSTSTAEISKDGQPFLWLANDTSLAVKKEEPAVFQITGGEVIADDRTSGQGVDVILQKAIVHAKEAVWSASVQKGSLSICVYYGKVSVDGLQEEYTVAAGEQLSVIQKSDKSQETEVIRMQAVALNDFEMGRLLLLTGDGFCFSKEDIDMVKQKRENDKVKAQQAKILADNTSEQNEEEASEETETREKKSASDFSIKRKTKTTDLDTETKTKAQTETEEKESETKQAGTTSQEDTKQQKKTQESQKPQKPDTPEETESTTPPAPTPTEEQEAKTYCTIEIRCDTILNNMKALTAGKEGYVPADGTVLAVSKVEMKDGDSVFDVLKRACDLADIQLEYSYTPIYESYYVEGIHQLYEFDCGSESGWMYKVNGWFPNYGCSSYKVKENDEIVFCYTCNGLGADVGGGTY